MGQQQLLLLVLGIVIVGIAVVAGIQAFSEGKAKAAQDAAVSDAMRIISDVQAWKLKPGAFGGGGDTAPTSFLDKAGTAVNFKALGYPVANTGAVYVTINGCYALAGSASGAAIDVHQISADPTTNGDTVGTALTACPGTDIADISVVGADPNDISWTYN